ncbi:short-chain dehydrogenase [Aspergillus campestris IBT 28561]|uniref:Short-chain dehydrogenase n=1 Tax=Aspergillus campestris (strain IBT 28561) TaxID=1392248 RepID=A0A2I1CVB4_ASPC2|nr:short-chain dehydrogenase [Aspergillus campestris IBT 28561]PKY01561.1 short-chain dehydrogenase [Aspergillus campestris IBT 28561]
MTELHITVDDLISIKGKTVLITGCSSGIGNATLQLCLQLGANIIAGDLTPLSEDILNTPDLLFAKTDVTDWHSIRALFIAGYQHFGQIDHVFANAGIKPTRNFLDATLDADGLLAPPDLATINVNFLGVINTVRLAMHYLRQDSVDSKSRSIVLSASASAIQNFPAPDYCTTKHGVVGLLHGLTGELESTLRINAIAPSWTASGIVIREVVETLGAEVQDAEVVARSVLKLFVDFDRHGEILYSWNGRFFEINKAKGGLLDSAAKLLPDTVSEDEIMTRLVGVVAAVEGEQAVNGS